MDPARKRQIRLGVALTVAVLLAAALVYTSFSAGTEAREPSDLLALGPNGETYKLTGKVSEEGPRDGGSLEFEVTDRDGGGEAIPVEYSGIVPDPFREGREVIVTGTLSDQGVFLAEADSLVTKCPSKFTEAKEEFPDNVILEDG